MKRGKQYFRHNKLQSFSMVKDYPYTLFLTVKITGRRQNKELVILFLICFTQGTVWEQLCLLRGNIQIRFKSPNLIDSLIFSVAFVCSLTNTMKGEIQGNRAGAVVRFRPCVVIWDDSVVGFCPGTTVFFSPEKARSSWLFGLLYLKVKALDSVFGVCIKRTGLFVIVFFER